MRALLALLIACQAAWLSEPAAAKAPPQDPMLSAVETWDGRGYEDHARLWWQWVMRRSEGMRAYHDPDGAQCGLDQSGDVWYLAGTAGTERVRRHCRIPEGTHLFLPAIASLSHAAPGQPRTCAQVQTMAKGNSDALVEMQVTLDGQALTPVRGRSADCFDAFVHAPDLWRADRYFPAASDGHWLFLRPLPRGRHELKVRARFDDPDNPMGGFEQDFIYDLEVVRPGELESGPSDGDSIRV